MQANCEAAMTDHFRPLWTSVLRSGVGSPFMPVGIRYRVQPDNAWIVVAVRGARTGRLFGSWAVFVPHLARCQERLGPKYACRTDG